MPKNPREPQAARSFLPVLLFVLSDCVSPVLASALAKIRFMTFWPRSCVAPVVRTRGSLRVPSGSVWLKLVGAGLSLIRRTHRPLLFAFVGFFPEGTPRVIRRTGSELLRLLERHVWEEEAPNFV